MGDKRLNDLLRWSIEHMEADSPVNQPTNESRPPPTTNLTPEIMAALMGGPSDAELMKAAMEIINDPEVSLENKLIAFDNFEQLIENLDNANNIANLDLWTPLLDQLRHEESEMRKMAAWCVGTAVQNNARTQERLLAMGGLPSLVEMALKQEEPEDVRRKAIYALSSAVRNYQPSMDTCTDELNKRGFATASKVDAADMDAVDTVIHGLRDHVKNTAPATSS
ncbi:Fes1-domain-containing protein [Trichoderma citrinoviride]|uniref:Fes1-domain-containing protein n=1 Tax=Trichoderma citrinoviride TaxID=58853 RepID=A0A2T4BF62_9HYPO|nr:Fes1-domain-containing protein [Trichoderma citrinoviride]PTB67977.1 Fes1-domain-containing protein [Trichoderma citrinoviride]